jgi:hypothetical protein
LAPRAFTVSVKVSVKGAKNGLVTVSVKLLSTFRSSLAGKAAPTKAPTYHSQFRGPPAAGRTSSAAMTMQNP